LQIGNESGIAGMMSTAAAATAAGATTIPVAAVQTTGGNPPAKTNGYAAGQPLMIGTGQTLELTTVTAVGTAGATGTGLTVSPALKYAHAVGDPVRVNEGQPVGMTGDSVEHLNMWASGAPHGVDDESQPTQELLRALELPATYTALLVSNDKYLGAVPAPTGSVAYFETDPVNPTSTKTVNFDAGFARGSDGTTDGLTYYWDFGDGTHATVKTVSHTYYPA